MEVCVVEADWTVRAIRGATTVPENTAEAIREAVAELLDELERHNSFEPEQIVSVTFSVTPDLDALFPASVARQRPHWDNVPLLDVQHMSVKGDLERCVRFLLHVHLDAKAELFHPYLRQAQALRPDWSLSSSVGSS